MRSLSDPFIVILNLFQDPFLVFPDELRIGANRAVCFSQDSAELSAQWVLKHVQDDEFGLGVFSPSGGTYPIHLRLMHFAHTVLYPSPIKGEEVVTFWQVLRQQPEEHLPQALPPHPQGQLRERQRAAVDWNLACSGKQ